jgi:4-diphosphocytidyl-2-C-methyl-D-erythritol kinase
MPTTELAPAKLTRSLRVTGVRDDGYHLLESEMVTLDLADELVIEPAETSTLEIVDEIAWVGSAAPVLDVPLGETNLAHRALTFAGVSARVIIRKRIPPGAGLGGGSADAAAVLRYAGVSDLAAAAQLGADVPFCVIGGRALVRGIGEQVEMLPPLAADFVVVSPAFGVSTPAVYQAFDELGPGESANDLERAACAVEPRLASVRSTIAAIGVAPVLAGSGSSYFIECAADDAPALRDAITAALVAGDLSAQVVCARATGPLLHLA